MANETKSFSDSSLSNRQLLSSTKNNLNKQFGPRSGPTECQFWSGFKMFDTLIVLLKEFFDNFFLKSQQAATKT